jgi:hypothetical protein
MLIVRAVDNALTAPVIFTVPFPSRLKLTEGEEPKFSTAPEAVV